MNVVEVASPTNRPFFTLQEIFLVLISVRARVYPTAVMRRDYVKKSSASIGNRTRDLPTFSAMPQPTAPSRASPLLPVYYD